MNLEDRATLVALDEVLRSDKVLSLIRPIVQRVRGKLGTMGEAELMAWEPIPLETFGRGLPQGIRSGWIFILRAGADTGPERHPNSHQRMMTLDGTGDMRVRAGLASMWRSDFLISDPDAPLERRWISIPPNTWHQPVVGKDAHWVVVSFHTVRAEELVEEKPDSDRGRGTKRKKYVETVEN